VGRTNRLVAGIDCSATDRDVIEPAKMRSCIGLVMRERELRKPKHLNCKSLTLLGNYKTVKTALRFIGLQMQYWVRGAETVDIGKNERQ
jgi:hypothetical protein